MLKDTLKLGGVAMVFTASLTIGSSVGEWLWDNVIEDALDDVKRKIVCRKTKKES